MFSEACEFGQRVDVHLSHHLGTMRFDRPLRDVQITRDLLVQSPVHDAPEYFAFACRKSGVETPRRGKSARRTRFKLAHIHLPQKLDRRVNGAFATGRPDVHEDHVGPQAIRFDRGSRRIDGGHYIHAAAREPFLQFFTDDRLAVNDEHTEGSRGGVTPRRHAMWSEEAEPAVNKLADPANKSTQIGS
jgi:hypothetical protein